MRNHFLGVAGLIVPALLAAIAATADAAPVDVPQLTDTAPIAADAHLSDLLNHAAFAERGGRKGGGQRSGDGKGRRGCKKKGERGQRDADTSGDSETSDDPAELQDGERRRRKHRKRRGRRGGRGDRTGGQQESGE